MTATTSPDVARQTGYLHGRIIDFICLGGGSLPILCFLALLPPAEYRAYVLIPAVYLSHLINNPHFINSYQIFYSGYAAKIAPDGPLRIRYLIAGILVPVMMALFFAYAVLTSDVALLGQSVNVMFFLVGWHYAKQGYGIFIVESVLRV